MEVMPIERCATGIVGFDKITRGGFVKNSNNVLIGGPGSGKTTFLLQFLWNGATRFNENGLYCSFEPDIVETLKDAMAFGWDFTKLNEMDKVKFLKFSPQTSMEELKSALMKIIAKHDVKRICFDPISIISLSSNNDGKIREAIFELVSLMKRLNVTSILADESLEGSCEGRESGAWSKTDIIKFLSDSVVTLHESGLSGVGDRAARVLKMRRTAHVRGPVGMQITNQGIQIMPEGTV